MKKGRYCLAIAGSVVLLTNYGTSFQIPSTNRVSSCFRPSKGRLVCTQKDSSVSSTNLPLIDAGDQWGNWAALTGAASLAQILGRSTKVGKLLGPPVTAMALTFAMASIGILNSGGTTAAKSLQLLSLQLATPLVLLGADLRDAGSQCGPLLVSFLLAAVSTVAGCLVAWKFAGTRLTASLGKDGLAIAAALMAKNIGGGINYVAVCQSLNASSTAVAAGLCVDNIFALIYFPLTSIFARDRPDISDQTAINEEKYVQPELSVSSFSNAVFLASTLLWLGQKIGGSAGSSLPTCTILTVLLASRAPRSSLRPLQGPAELLGTLCLYLFFATAGAPGIAVAESVRSSLFPLTVFLTFLYTIHGAILYASSRLFKAKAFAPQRLLVSSSAAIGGPATAVALATQAGWDSLKAPSLLVGNIGYAIATFCGLAYHSLLK